MVNLTEEDLKALKSLEKIDGTYYCPHTKTEIKTWGKISHIEVKCSYDEIIYDEKRRVTYPRAKSITFEDKPVYSFITSSDLEDGFTAIGPFENGGFFYFKSPFGFYGKDQGYKGHPSKYQYGTNLKILDWKIVWKK